MSINIILLIAVASIIVIYAISIFSYKYGRKSIITKPDTCFLCSTHRDKVEFMIAGNSGVLCSGCMQYGLAWLDNDKLGELKVPRNLLLSLVEFLSLSEKELDQRIEALILSMLQKTADLNIQTFRNIINRALAHEQATLALNLFKALPPNAWEESDHVNWLWANCELHKFEDALRPIPGQPEINDTISGYLILVNQIWAKLNIEPTLSSKDIKDYLTKLFEIHDGFQRQTELTEERRKYYLGILNSNIAQCYYRIKEFDKSKKYLNIALEFSGEDKINNIILRGDIANATGNKKAAFKFFGRALKLATADGIINEKIKNRINELKNS
jgi:tetratricopeptide (TPR) repeat protein